MAESGKKQSRFELVIGAVDKMSGPFKAMQARMDAMGKSCDRLKANFARLSDATGLTRLAGSVGNVRAGLRNVVAESKNAVSGVVGLVGKLSLAFGAAGGGALALAKSTADAGDRAAKAAARAGVGITVWQEYAHAASLSDVNEEQLSKGFLKLQDAALKAAGGDKTKMAVLKMAGIDPKTAKGEVKNAEQLFLELADSVKKLQDAGQAGKAANLLTAIAGEEGVKLMPMLTGGAKGLKELRAEAHKLGIVFKDEDARASEAFNDSLTRAGDALKGIGYTIGKVVLPPLTKLVDKFTAWASGNREVMGTGFAEWVESIDIDELWSRIESGLSTLNDLRKSIAEVVDGLGGWEKVAKIVGALLAAKLIGAVWGLASAFGGLGAAIMTTPVGWILAAAAAIYAVYKNWDRLVKAWKERPGISTKMVGGTDYVDPATAMAMGGDVAAAGARPDAGGEQVPLGEAQNLGPTVAGITRHTKTETVERNELEVKIRPVEGYDVQAALAGQSVGDILNLDNGQLMQGAW